MTQEEIKAEVYRRFPKTDEERHCRTHRELITKAREDYRRKLEQKHLHKDSPTGDEQV